MCPYKYEKLNDTPEIGYIHEFVSEKICQKIINKAATKLVATPYNTNGKYTQYSSKRTSKMTYLDDEQQKNETLYKLNRKIELVTKMTINEKHGVKEKIQVNLKFCYLWMVLNY